MSRFDASSSSEGYSLSVNEYERRKSFRMPLSSIAVLRRFIDKREKYPPDIGYTRDISPLGLYMYTTGRPKEGESVHLTIHAAVDWAEGGTPPKVEGRGKIIRVETAEQGFPPLELNGVAIQFEAELAVLV